MFVMQCDACSRRIDPAPGSMSPSRDAYVELTVSISPERRRHYHRTPECWEAVRDGLLAAEQAARV